MWLVSPWEEAKEACLESNEGMGIDVAGFTCILDPDGGLQSGLRVQKDYW
jgi:hypothetical protein